MNRPIGVEDAGTDDGGVRPLLSEGNESRHFVCFDDAIRVEQEDEWGAGLTHAQVDTGREAFIRGSLDDSHPREGRRDA